MSIIRPTLYSTGAHAPPAAGGGVVYRGKRERAKHPRDIEHNIANHEHVVDVMVVRGRDEHPSSTRQGAEYPYEEEEAGDA